MLNGWTNDGSVGAADFGYRKDDQDVVYLQGRIDGGSSTNVTIFTLPAAYRPSTHVYTPAITTAGVLVLARVAADGNVNIELPATPDNVSLDGISFKI